MQNETKCFGHVQKLPKAVVDTRLILLVRRISKKRNEQCSTNRPVLLQNALCIGIYVTMLALMAAK